MHDLEEGWELLNRSGEESLNSIEKFDIERFTTKVSSIQRDKILLLKESIKKLERNYGKQIPIEVIREEIRDLSDTDFQEAIEKLKKSGDIFQPKYGFVQSVVDN